MRKRQLFHAGFFSRRRETARLTPVFTPANATDQRLIYASSDERVATVDQNGTVTTWNTGYAMITATANDGSGVKGSCNFAVVGLSVTHAPTATPSPSPAPTLAPGQTPVPPSLDTAATLELLEEKVTPLMAIS